MSLQHLATAVADATLDWTCASADRGLLSHVLAESRVEQTPARPAMSEYAEAWGEAFERWLTRFMASHRGLWDDLSWVFEILSWLLVGVAVVLLAVVVVRLLRRGARSAAETAAASDPTPPHRDDRRDRGGWRREIEQRLADGDVDGALEALWWWFAASLVPVVDPSWTSGELLHAARRSDLASAAVEIDQAIYGSRRPQSAEIASLLTRLEGSLA